MYMAHICDCIIFLLDEAILELIVQDTLMCQSGKFPTLYPFIPFQGQHQAILPALSMISGEW